MREEIAGRRRPVPAVLAKADALLGLLADAGELNPAGAADLMDEPRSSVYRLLEAMQEVSWVEPGPGRTYQLSPKLIHVGTSARRQHRVWEAALPVMEQLREDSGASLYLWVRHGPGAVCIERIDGLGVQSPVLQPGGAMPLHAGAAPLALLAFGPEDEWEEYLRSTSCPEGTRSVLSQARQNGYVVTDGDVTPGMAAIGVPVLEGASAVAALSGSGLRAYVLEHAGDDLRAALQTAAVEISSALATSDPDAEVAP